MITQEDINTVLGAACYNLGYFVENAALYRDVVPAEITDEMLKAECDKIKAQLKAPPTTAATLASVQAQLVALTAQLATLTAATSGN